MKQLFLITMLIIGVTSFDYLLFVQLWPGSWIHADQLHYNFTNNYFSVHGVWPQYFNGSYPEYCNNKTKFQIDKISSIKKNLTKYWTNFANTTNFLEHEFIKHMTCAMNTYNDPYILFDIGLALREKYNLYQLFAKNDIIPNNKIKYELHKLYNIIKQTYGVDVVITCEPNLIINEIRFCMDKQFNIFNCPTNVYNEQCNSTNVIYNKIIY